MTASAPAPERLVGADRVLAVLKVLAAHGDGASLDELTRAIGSPKPSVHRALAALRRAGLADQRDDGRYLLGDELLRLAFTNHEARPDHLRIRPVLEQLARHFGETTHFAVLDGREVVYRAKVDPAGGAVRLTSVIGGRNPAHATGVGKLLLAHALPTLRAVREWVADAPLATPTSRTIRSATALHRALEEVRARGFATDDGENEDGINCIAIPVSLASPSVVSGAVSVSALAYRTPLQALIASLEDITTLVADLAYRP
jgi:IclR family transcriptional regulator, acetate operon repressor